MKTAPTLKMAPLFCGASFWVASLENDRWELPSQTCTEAKKQGLNLSLYKESTLSASNTIPSPKVPKVRAPKSLPTIIGPKGNVIQPQNYMPQELPFQPLEGYGSDIAKVGKAIRKARSNGRARMTVFGASHTEGEFWTGHMRRVLQHRYGDIGHGFIMPVPLFRRMRAADINYCSSGGWNVDYVGAKQSLKDGLLGLGMSASAIHSDEFAWIETTKKNPLGRKAAIYDLLLLSQPEGGTLLASIDNKQPVLLPTFSPQPDIYHARIETEEGPHRLSLQPAGDGEVRFFGISAETPGPGMLVDAIGIRGKEARSWLQWNERIFKGAIQALNPDIVVLAYGTNEANALDYTAEKYAKDLRKTLSKMRRSLPDAACILVGPSDRGKAVRYTKNTYKVWERTTLIAQVQRNVSVEFGCVFWDWQQATGGEGSMIAWRYTDPPLAAKDLIHHSAAGYIHVAEKFIEALDDAADNY